MMINHAEVSVISDKNSVPLVDMFVMKTSESLELFEILEIFMQAKEEGGGNV
jgi:hypothetical protein